MADFGSRFASRRQDWSTPDDIFQPLHAEFGFTLDAAASADNRKVVQFLSEADNAMRCDWGSHVVWLNPPYGSGHRLADWVAKAHQAALAGATVVMMIPARTNTAWFHQHCLRAEVRFLRGRPKFGGADHGLPQPLCIVIFRPPPTETRAAVQRPIGVHVR